MTSDRDWSVDQHVHADAESIFVPAEHLDGAEQGDVVVVHDPDASSTIRRGQVSERVTDVERGDSFIVRLDPAPPATGDSSAALESGGEAVTRPSSSVVEVEGPNSA